jgi:hypothetical protein
MLPLKPRPESCALDALPPNPNSSSTINNPNSSSQSQNPRILRSASIQKKPTLNPSVSRKINIDYHNLAMQHYSQTLTRLRHPKPKKPKRKKDEEL